jgi:hypothetical protein
MVQRKRLPLAFRKGECLLWAGSGKPDAVADLAGHIGLVLVAFRELRQQIAAIGEVLVQPLDPVLEPGGIIVAAQRVLVE